MSGDLETIRSLSLSSNIRSFLRLPLNSLLRFSLLIAFDILSFLLDFSRLIEKYSLDSLAILLAGVLVLSLLAEGVYLGVSFGVEFELLVVITDSLFESLGLSLRSESLDWDLTINVLVSLVLSDLIGKSTNPLLLRFCFNLLNKSLFGVLISYNSVDLLTFSFSLAFKFLDFKISASIKLLTISLFLGVLLIFVTFWIFVVVLGLYELIPLIPEVPELFELLFLSEFELLLLLIADTFDLSLSYLSFRLALLD